jgi:membrane-bound lytic murein transglycosylase D
LESAEPTSEDEAESLGSVLPTGLHSSLSADPSDYSVGKNNTIVVQAAETLGHYAEWLDLRASQLRRLNKRRYGKPLVIGKRLKLDFSRVKPELFEQRRQTYHRSIQEEFFERFQITSKREHVIRRGDSLWVLAQRKYKVPVWLLRQYNPDLDFSAVRPGTKVSIPLLEQRSENAGSLENGRPS